MLDIYTQDEKPHDYCGIAGAVSPPGEVASNIVVEMGKALQHRGQNGAGLAVKSRGKLLKVFKKARAFNEVFTSPEIIDDNFLKGEVAIAHLRYPTEGSMRRDCDAQPFYAAYQSWEIAVGHNGSLVDLGRLRDRLKKFQIELESDSDSEILSWLIVTSPGLNWKQKIANALADVKGAYSLVMVTGDDKLIALRDPWGIRPLVWSQDNGHVFVASETCALDRINIRHNKKIDPGQILIASADGISVSDFTKPQKTSFCVFEKLYFSHETSSWDGIIGENRESLGEQLAEEEITRIKNGEVKKQNFENIDYVVAVPDTASPGAHSFAETLIEKFGAKVKYKRGLVKERYDYAKRTFIEDDPYLRQKNVEKKFFISPAIIGKSIYLVDDTAVRLTTYSILVAHLLRVGVKEVHCRFLAPKFLNPCFLGVNIGSRSELGAVAIDKQSKYHELTEAQIKKTLKVSSVHYLSLPGMAKSLGLSTQDLHQAYCTGCLDYNNPFDMRPYDREFSKTTYLNNFTPQTHDTLKTRRPKRHYQAA